MASCQILGVSQTEIEEEFYMKDIPQLIEEKHTKNRQEKINEYFIQLQLMIASNDRAMDPDDYKHLVRNLTKNLEDNESKNDTDKLDRQALETLRLMTSMGANRTGGG